MLSFRMLLSLDLANPSLSLSIPLFFHLTLFFSCLCALFFTTAASYVLSFPLFTDSFHPNGGCTYSPSQNYEEQNEPANR
jgi:hypothetical protein